MSDLGLAGGSNSRNPREKGLPNGLGCWSTPRYFLGPLKCITHGPQISRRLGDPPHTWGAEGFATFPGFPIGLSGVQRGSKSDMRSAYLAPVSEATPCACPALSDLLVLRSCLSVRCPSVHLPACLSVLLTLPFLTSHVALRSPSASASPLPPNVLQPDGTNKSPSFPPSPAAWYRCTEENEAGLLDLEQMSQFGKGLDLHQASEEAFDVKAVYNSTLDSEALKQTLFRQAKNQVGRSGVAHSKARQISSRTPKGLEMLADPRSASHLCQQFQFPSRLRRGCNFPPPHPRGLSARPNYLSEVHVLP